MTVGFPRMARQCVSASLLCGALLLAGCSPVGLIVGAAGVATDTNMGWAIVKHVHAKLTEGDPIPCVRLNSLERALNPRCGAFVPGSLLARDIRDTALQECPLAVVVRDPQLWPVLPELLDKGAQPERCTGSPLIELAQRQACPDFASAAPAERDALRWLAEVDARAIHHDVVRMLSCPGARAAGLDRVLSNWLAQGELDRARLAFSPLDALHPSALATPLASALEARGDAARDAFGPYDGELPRGFEEALRTSDWAALEWWLARVPDLANRVPPAHRNQLPWVPLARVLVPSFLAYPASRTEMVEFLMARGADPSQRLPYDAGSTVAQYARTIGSPLAPLLDAPRAPQVVATTPLPAS